MTVQAKRDLTPNCSVDAYSMPSPHERKVRLMIADCQRIMRNTDTLLLSVRTVSIHKLPILQINGENQNG